MLRLSPDSSRLGYMSVVRAVVPPHLQPAPPATCLGPSARSLPRCMGPELKSEHVQGIKETHLLSETTGLGPRVYAAPAQILSDLILCYKLKQAPLLLQRTVQLCISQVVKKRSGLLQPFSKSPQSVI